MKKIIFGLTFLIALFLAEPAFAYTVEKGDTMSKIAKEHGVTLDELAVLNPQVENLDLIHIGQVIHTEVKEAVEDLSNASEHRLEINSPTPVTTTTEPKVEKSEPTNLTLSNKDIDLLARLVRAEAQTEPFEGKVAVAAVVLNRVDSPKFPNTIRGVIYQKRQFQPVSNGQINRAADEESIRAVYAALTDMRHIAQGSLFFYNPKIATSRWLDKRQTVVAIGQHVFKN
ncbi:cell wall hydrolase [Bacillus suaedaesalsae]|uniref:Cell wall hydrolase n=1 Tax=Bacillus suaedaesalsae TaxID=2810349 RepID=A0ABS2DDY2_9BACI|nr:cell wall hydrolase [Bacillus suaedaesalsae]MBM6616674.1 cell wall hydrolase [Bacillus suaedaesalsae]